MWKHIQHKMEENINATLFISTTGHGDMAVFFFALFFSFFSALFRYNLKYNYNILKCTSW